MGRTRAKHQSKEFDAPSSSVRVCPFTTSGGYRDRSSRTRPALSGRLGTVTTDTPRNGVRCNTLILGMGSEFLGDDGLGVHALRELGKESLPEGTELIEVANHLVDALVALQRADRIILLDALRAQGSPGSVYRVSFHPIQNSEGMPLSPTPDLFRALYMGRCFGFLDVIVIGMEPSVMDWSAKLSEEVRNALPLMIRAVRAELDRPVFRGQIENTIPFAEKAISNPLSNILRRYA